MGYDNIRLVLAVWLVVALGQCARGTLEPGIIADSAGDFSGVQGQDNWYYGYYDGDVRLPFTPSDFELSPNLVTNDEGQWWMPQAGAGGYFTRVGQYYMHPNGLITSGGRQSIEHWAVRRWISEVSGEITISGNLSDRDGGYGDGIIGYILADGVKIFEQRIYDSDYDGVDYMVTASVNTGSIVDFAVAPGPNSSDIRDMTRFTAVITPEPGTLLFFGVGGVAVLRRRRNRRG
ncbi:MAG: PEP-CTERM sorting domain-containing protein [Planctomycetota bacterium]|jgi:hypothetical protein